MNNRTVELRVGVLVLASALIAMILIVQLGELPSFGSYEVHVWFPQAPDVAPGTPVYKSGVRIGRVKSVSLAEDFPEADHADGVIVTAKIDPNRKIFADEDAWIDVSLMGDSSLNFVRRRPAPGQPASKQPADVEQVLTGRMKATPREVMENFQEMFEQVTAPVTSAASELAVASKKMGETADAVNRMVGENGNDLQASFEQANRTMAAIELAVNNVNGLIGDAQMQQDIRDTIAAAPETIADTRRALKSMEELMGGAKQSLDDINQITAALSDDETLRNLQNGVRDLAHTLEGIDQLTDAINQQKGSLGQLVHDPALYQNLNQATKNLNELTWQLKPIVRDVRVFTDKVARHPGVVVRDAMRPGVGIK